MRNTFPSARFPPINDGVQSSGAQSKQVQELSVAAESTTENQAAMLAELWRGLEGLERGGLPAELLENEAASTDLMVPTEGDSEKAAAAAAAAAQKSDGGFGAPLKEQSSSTSPLSRHSVNSGAQSSHRDRHISSAAVDAPWGAPQPPLSPLTPIQKAMQHAGIIAAAPLSPRSPAVDKENNN